MIANEAVLMKVWARPRDIAEITGFGLPPTLPCIVAATYVSLYSREVLC